MNKIFFRLVGFTSVLLLVGAGCSTLPTKQSDTSMTSGSTSDSDEVEYSTFGDGVLELNAVSVSKRQVKFEWALSKALDEPNKFILLRSFEPDPTHDGETNWFRQHGTRRSVTWVNLPAGKQHFRMCTSVDGDTCYEYSNTVSHTVPSEVTVSPKDEEIITDTSETKQARHDAALSTAKSFYNALIEDDEEAARELLFAGVNEADWDALLRQPITGAVVQGAGDTSGIATDVTVLVTTTGNDDNPVERTDTLSLFYSDSWKIVSLPL